MTTLVTGAGVIGCHTARLLAQRGESVLLADVAPALAAIATIVDDPRVRIEVADVTDFARLTRLVESHGVRRIVHTAALLSTAIRQDPVKGVEVNVMGTAHLLEVARRHRLERVVIASSTTVGYPVFGDFEGDSLPEDFSLKSIRHRPGSIYAATKVAAEHLALLYRDLYGVNTVSLRYAAVISAWSGPGTSVPARVLSSLAGPAARGEVSVIDDPYLVWQGGEEFIDARDCAHANVAALDAEDPAQGIYHIGLGRLHGFEDFVAGVHRCHPALRVDMRVAPQGGFAGFAHVRRAASDISAAARELAWQPTHALADSIEHFAPFCIANEN